MKAVIVLILIIMWGIYADLYSKTKSPIKSPSSPLLEKGEFKKVKKEKKIKILNSEKKQEAEKEIEYELIENYKEMLV